LSNWARLAISALAGAILTAAAYLLPFTPLLYLFAPGFWLGDLLPAAPVNRLGGYLFPVFASFIVWTILIFAVWRLTAKKANLKSHGEAGA
jgi:hypothetical protein